MHSPFRALSLSLISFLLISSVNLMNLYGQSNGGGEMGILSSSPTQIPELLLVGQIGSYALAATIQGNYAFVTDCDGLRIINIIDPTNPTQVGFFDTESCARGVAVRWPYVYVADDGDGLRIINVNDPRHPFAVGFMATQGHAFDVELSGNYVYLADQKGGLRIIDINNPQNPFEASFISGVAKNVSVKNNYAYMACGGYGMRMIDISNPLVPVEVGFFNGGYGVTDVAASDSYAYIIDMKEYAVDPQKMRIVSTTDPGNLTEIGLFSWSGGTESIAVKGNYAFLAEYHSAAVSGLRILDISKPANPVQVGFETGGYATYVTLAGNYVYLTSIDSGLLIFWYGYPVHSAIPISGGEFSSAVDNTFYKFPPNAFSSEASITHTSKFPSSIPTSGNMINIGHSFETTAIYTSSGGIAYLAPGKNYTISVSYTDAERGSAIEQTLGLHYWNGSQWIREPTSTVDISSKKVSATPNHFSIWAVLGESHKSYLPFIECYAGK